MNAYRHFRFSYWVCNPWDMKEYSQNQNAYWEDNKGLKEAKMVHK